MVTGPGPQVRLDGSATVLGPLPALAHVGPLPIGARVALDSKSTDPLDLVITGRF